MSCYIKIKIINFIFNCNILYHNFLILQLYIYIYIYIYMLWDFLNLRHWTCGYIRSRGFFFPNLWCIHTSTRNFMKFGVCGIFFWQMSFIELLWILKKFPNGKNSPKMKPMTGSYFFWSFKKNIFTFCVLHIGVNYTILDSIG